jgi:hypothetical protein
LEGRVIKTSLESIALGASHKGGIFHSSASFNASKYAVIRLIEAEGVKRKGGSRPASSLKQKQMCSGKEKPK